MATIIPPGYAEAALRLDLANDPDPMYITFGIDISEAGGDFDAVAESIFTATLGTLEDVISSEYTIPGVRLSIGQDGGGSLSGYFPFSAIIEGEDGPNPSTQNVAYLIQKRTGTLGRQGRGRMFVPGVTEGQVGPTGLLTDAQRDALDLAWNTWLDQLAGGDPGTPMVLLHSEGVELAPTPVLSLVTDQRVATQRRRLRR